MVLRILLSSRDPRANNLLNNKYCNGKYKFFFQNGHTLTLYIKLFGRKWD